MLKQNFITHINKIKNFVKYRYETSFGLNISATISNIITIMLIIDFIFNIKPYNFDGYKEFVIIATFAFCALVISGLSIITFVLLLIFKKKTIVINKRLLNNKIYFLWFSIGLVITIVSYIFAFMFFILQ